jgi:hypothetical protein
MPLCGRRGLTSSAKRVSVHGLIALVAFGMGTVPLLAEESAAEQSMASAAWWQLAVSIAGLLALLATLIISIAANRTATRALFQSASTSRKELRAYLSVSPAGVSRMKRVEPRIIGHMALQNVGHVFATGVKISVKMLVSNNREFGYFPLDEDTAEYIGTVHPGAIVRRGADVGAPPPRRPAKGMKTYIFVWGGVWYNDGFDNERRFTRFCHRYNVASRSPGASFVIEPEKARYHNYGPNEAS